MRTVFFSSIALGLVVTCLVSICGSNAQQVSQNGISSPQVVATPTPHSDPVLEENVQRWTAAGIESYDMTATLFEGGTRGYAFPVIISIRDGKYASIRAVEKDNRARMDGYEPYNTVEKMFDVIRSHLGDKLPARVKYNARYGYPESISTGNLDAADAWRTFAVKKFVIVGNKGSSNS